MAKLQSLPKLWLLSDARNDAVLEQALADLPRESALVFRHYHLPGPERIERFRLLRRLAKARDHLVILADSALTAREWGADGIYGAPKALYPRRCDLVHVATAHNMQEIAQANLTGCDCVILSPAFATRSHLGAKSLGPLRFRTLAQHANMPVVALGGMTHQSAKRLAWSAWAAIDGLS